MPKKKDRDKSSKNISLGDQAHVDGDVFTGDKITTGDSSAVVTGHGSEATVNSEVEGSGEEIAKLFAEIYKKIEARPVDPDVDKEEIKSTVEKIEAEAAKGKEANKKKVGRWLRNLLAMAPDIFKVTATSLTSPVAGLGEAFRLIVEKAKKEAE